MAFTLTSAGDPTQPARRAVRYPTDLTVSLQGGPWLPNTPMRARDISRGGMFVCTEIPAELFSELSLKVQLPWGGELSLLVRVVHIVTAEKATSAGSVAGIGLELIEPNPTHKELVQRLVEWACRVAGGRGTALRTPKPVPSYLSAFQQRILSVVDGRRSEKEIAQCLQVSSRSIEATLTILQELNLVSFHSVESDARPTLPAPPVREASTTDVNATLRPADTGDADEAQQRVTAALRACSGVWTRAGAGTLVKAANTGR